MQLALLGQNYETVQSYHSELVGLQYTDMTKGTSKTPAEASKQYDTYDWTGGWRIQDIDKEIWVGGCDDECLFQETCRIFVLETSSMRIRYYNPIGYEGVIAAIEQIDLDNP